MFHVHSGAVLPVLCACMQLDVASLLSALAPLRPYLHSLRLESVLLTEDHVASLSALPVLKVLALSR